MTNEKNETKQEENKPSVEFSNCANYGDMIKALVNKFTGEAINTFVLTQAIEKIEENNKKIEEFKNKLLKRGK